MARHYEWNPFRGGGGGGGGNWTKEEQVCLMLVLTSPVWMIVMCAFGQVTIYAATSAAAHFGII